MDNHKENRMLPITTATDVLPEPVHCEQRKSWRLRIGKLEDVCQQKSPASNIFLQRSGRLQGERIQLHWLCSTKWLHWLCSSCQLAIQSLRRDQPVALVILQGAAAKPSSVKPPLPPSLAQSCPFLNVPLVSVHIVAV